MLIDDFLPLEQLLEYLDRLSPELDKKYHIRAALIPRWKNFLIQHVDRFDRYPEMITHGSVHICNVLALAADLLLPPLEARKQYSDKKSPITGEELFLLIAGIFLHDIGMADVEKSVYMPNEVRTRHSVLTGEILVKRRKNSDWFPTENLLPGFDSDSEVDVLVQICVHHQSKAPLCEESQKNSESTADSLETLIKNASHLQVFNNKPIDIFFITALLRILDACDTQYSRAGSIFFTAGKITNNRRLIEEYKQRLEWNDPRKEFYKKYITYLGDQEARHFPKHSFIQKVWIIDREVIYKPISPQEKDLLPPEMQSHIRRLSDFLDIFQKEIETERAACNPYLGPRGMDIRGVRPFNPDTDPVAVSRIKAFGKHGRLVMPNRMSDLPRPYFEKELINSGKHLIVITAQEGSGKTSMARRLALSLFQNKRVCLIAFDTVRDKKDYSRLWQYCFRQFIYFLASWGDYLFYNKIRMDVEMEESHWDILLSQLDQKEHVFIFDDMHFLPLQKDYLPECRFFINFFKRISTGSAKAIILTQKIPPPLTLPGAPIFEMKDIPPFSDKEIAQMFQTRRYFGFKAGEWPEGEKTSAMLVQNYAGLPVVVDHIKGEAALIHKSSPDATLWLEAAVNGRMKEHIGHILSILENEAKLLMNFLRQYPALAVKDFLRLSRCIGMAVNDVETGWKQLELRRLIRPNPDNTSVYSIDAWQEKAVSCRWNILLKNLFSDAAPLDSLIEEIPELEILKGLDQGSHHYLDAWNHTLAVFEGLREMLKDPEAFLPGLPLPKRPDILLMAALLHDIGKPARKVITDKGIQFIGHEDIGAEMAAGIGSRLGLSSDAVLYLKSLVSLHMRPLHLISNWPASDKAIDKMAGDSAPYTSDILLLSMADIRASRKPGSEGADPEHLNALVTLISQPKIDKPPEDEPLLTGKDLQARNMPPGPGYKIILTEALALQKGGRLSSREEAMAWLDNRILKG